MDIKKIIDEVFNEENEKRIFISLKDYIDKFYKEHKYGKTYLEPGKENLKQSNDRKLETKWFEEIVKLGNEGKVIDKYTLNDLWHIEGDYLKKGQLFYRLQHDNPNIKMDTRWIEPKK